MLTDLIIILGATGALIAWMDWILSNKDEALDYSSDDGSDSFRATPSGRALTLRATPLRVDGASRFDPCRMGDWPNVPAELRAGKPATCNSVAGGDGSQDRQRASALKHRDASIVQRPLGGGF